MRKVSDGDLLAFVDVCQERTLVVHFEGEDAVFVGGAERRRVDGAVGGGGERFQGEPLEGGEHTEFELDGVGCGRGVGVPVGLVVD